ncbi:hypothetical protein V1478_018395 [Vespula squamosa]|uniref:Uncharacterized protein n=1 Tax=Vespula squamosa TaxID=30214 RepID=A0ABD1ZXF3_VESSQ
MKARFLMCTLKCVTIGEMQRYKKHPLLSPDGYRITVINVVSPIEVGIAIKATSECIDRSYRNSSGTVSDSDGSDGVDGVSGGSGGDGDDGGGTARISEENGNRRVDARTFTNREQRFGRSSDSRIVLDWKSEMLVRRTEATGNGVDIKAISQHQLSPFQTVGSEVEWSSQ